MSSFDYTLLILQGGKPPLHFMEELHEKLQEIGMQFVDDSYLVFNDMWDRADRDSHFSAGQTASSAINRLCESPG